MNIFRFLSLGLLVNLLFSSGAIHAQDDQAVQPVVIMQTSLGDISIELYPEKAPVTVSNFLSYVERGFYDGTIFHRVIANFMAQGGGFDPRMQPRATAAPIVNEADNRLRNERGTIAMARTNNPNSATSQFFINLRANAPLDWTKSNPGYAVFGRVIDGMETVDAMALQPTGEVNGYRDVPLEPIIITRAFRKAQ